MVRFGVTAALAVLLAGSALRADAQNAAPLVIRGATLIDGRGGAPVPNSIIVLQGNRIAQVGRAGQVQVPAGAQVIEARGKWVIPGLIDAKSNYYGYYGEAYLIWGVTSAVNSGGGGDVGTAERDAINHGIYAGPRLFNSIAALGGPGPRGDKQDEGVPGRYNYIVRTPQQARDLSRLWIDSGADFLSTRDGDGAPEIFAPLVEEAHAAGMAAVFRPMGPQVRARESALLGADVLIHSGNVGAQVSKNPEKWANYIDLPPDAYSDMDDAKAAEMIALLVERKVALEPDLMAVGRGFHKNWSRVQQETNGFFSDPALLAYYPKLRINNLMENVKSPETYLTPEQIRVRAAGFRNMAVFHKRFVDAGGRMLAASDIPQSPPGLGLHQEMTAFVEDVGITPMQALLSATSWVAEAMRLKDLGAVEAGKLADLVILDADPLQNILNTRRIDTVIKDGKPVDRRYHAWYKIRFGAAGAFSNPVVEGIEWAKGLKQATFRAAPGAVERAPDPESSPTPGIESLMPYVLDQDSPATTMTIKGFNFVQRSVVFLDGIPMPTEVVSRTEIRALVDDNMLRRAGRFTVEVKNPEPVVSAEWGAKSNTAWLIVPFKFTTKHSRNRF